MRELFLDIVNMSIAAGWLILAVLLLRLLLKKAPKWISVMLWGIVAVRLLCPFSVESALSLVPSTETIPVQIMEDKSQEEFYDSATLTIIDNPVLKKPVEMPAGTSELGLRLEFALWSFVWAFGMAVMLIHAAVSYIGLRKKVDTAVIVRDNIFRSENVASPFVLGIVRPKIYLPFKMDGQDAEHVIAHETAHVSRRDHWWKPLGFLLLTVHWFNPLMWLAYVLLCRDIELACDEKVIKKLADEQRADYSQALLTCSVDRRTIAACPLAFGEVGVKERVKSVLNYKKPAFWLVAAAVIVCTAAAVCFLTDPVTPNKDISGIVYETDEYLYDQTVYSFSYTPDELPVRYCAYPGSALYIKNDMLTDRDHDSWAAITGFSEIELDRDNFDAYFLRERSDDGVAGWHDKKNSAKAVRRQNEKAWRAVDRDGGYMYYVLQQKDGTVYLACGYYDSEGEIDPYSDDSEIRWLFKLKETRELSPDETDIPIENAEEWTESPVGYHELGFDGFVKSYGIPKYAIMSSIRSIPTVRIDSVENLVKFKENMAGYMNYDLSYPDAPSFNETTAKYDGEFFETSELLVLYIDGGLVGVRYNVDYVERTDDLLAIGVAELDPEDGATERDGWLIAIEMPKEQLAGVSEIDARITATVYTSRQILTGEILNSYVFEASEDVIKPRIALYDSGEFSFMFSAISSYFGYGSYVIEDDRLTLATSDGEFVYVFDMVGDTLVFDAGASSDMVWFSGMSDGSVFVSGI